MLREVWLDIGVEKVDIHKDVTVKVLLDSSTTGMFMNQKIMARHRFRLQKLETILQMTTYWFVIAWFDNQSTQKSEVRQAAKDIVKSEVYPQTYSS